MQTLYAPADGGGWMPVLIPNPSRARELIAQGYRLQPPEQKVIAEVDATVSTEEITEANERLNVNTASLAELIALEGVGVTIGKKIQALQGDINSIEDLIAISDRPNWQKLEHLVKFA